MEWLKGDRFRPRFIFIDPLRARALSVLFVDTAVKVQQTTIIASKAHRCSTAAFLSI